MKNKKSVIITICVILIVVIGIIVTFNILNDDNKLTSGEKKWINDNINTVQNINVVNNVNIFGNVGAGVFYDFINDLEKDYNLQINPVAFNYKENVNGLSLNVKNTINKNDTVFYEDHYVLVGLKPEVIRNIGDLANKKIGVISSDYAHVSNYLNNINNVSTVQYENEEVLLEAFKTNTDINYVLVPLTIYLDDILTGEYYINYHLSDIKLYYTISSNNDTLSSILVKYFNTWKNSLDEYFKREKFTLFTSSLNISETEVDALRSVSYNYGFVNNSPYEVIMSGNYGGIVAMYLDDFSKFTNLDFNYTKYRNMNKFKKALKNKEVDLYFNYYDLNNDYNNVNSGIIAEYSIVANKSDSVVINSLNGLIGKSVYVEDSSVIHNYLKNINGIDIKTYKDDKDLKKLNKENKIIVIDKNIFDLYKENKLDNYNERFSGALNETYTFALKNSSALYRLLDKYAMSLDSREMVYKGLYNHSLTVKTGSILGSIAKYILLVLALSLILIIIIYKSRKRIKIAKRITKEDKMKFIDQLTSLKNRNYLNEYINNWNNNTVYPQTMVVIDLNNIQFINDTLGYEEGDKQIKAAANILIKTQLDNSDVMRTDGNEFLVYLVGYTQKQVTNYIHKLNKEFKKLPYEYGAEFGYSIIVDDIKTIEDAIIEATDEMKKQKKNIEEEK